MARTRLSALGPGLLLAATAVGASHLVQATRAGAEAGLGWLGLVVFAHALKYPAFRFGPHFAATTGCSLLQAYRRQGRWALAVYAVVTLGTMFTVQAAVTLLTAGLLLAVLGMRVNPLGVSAVLLALGAGVLAGGRYRGLDRVNKVMILVLTLSTFAATAIALPRVDPSTLGLGLEALIDPGQVALAVALIGWMPSAPDVSVWHSLWVLERGRDRGEPLDLARVTFDFHVGYGGTLVLAACFVVLGAALLHGTGASLPESAGAFSRGLIDLYAETLGAWSRPIIGVCALATMASTMLAVLDGFPRALSGLALRFFSDESDDEETTGAAGRAYWAALGLLAAGSLVVMGLLLTSLKALVDVAASLSFLTAPVLSALNHRAVFSQDVGTSKRPPRWLWAMSLASIAAQVAFAGWFLLARSWGGA